MQETNIHNETHVERMVRLGEKCNAAHVTFGGRCLNCGFTPKEFRATLIAPRLDARRSY